jgi:hypothetical protein
VVDRKGRKANRRLSGDAGSSRERANVISVVRTAPACRFDRLLIAVVIHEVAHQVLEAVWFEGLKLERCECPRSVDLGHSCAPPVGFSAQVSIALERAPA